MVSFAARRRHYFLPGQLQLNKRVGGNGFDLSGTSNPQGDQFTQRVAAALMTCERWIHLHRQRIDSGRRRWFQYPTAGTQWRLFPSSPELNNITFVAAGAARCLISHNLLSVLNMARIINETFASVFTRVS